MAVKLDLANVVSEMERIRTEVLQIREDLLFRKGTQTGARGTAGVIHYAIDFSEVYAYANPIKSAEEFEIFSTDTPDDRRISQMRALSRLFFSDSAAQQNRKVVLLEPYEVELATYLQTQRDTTLHSVKRDAKPAFDEWKKIRADTRFMKVLRLASRIQSGAADEQELREVLEYFETRATSVLAFLNRAYDDPLARIRDLFERARFDTEESLAGRPIEVESETTERWFQKLSALRRHERSDSVRNWQDALAVATLEVLNKLLAGRNERVLLISRSKHMLEVASSEEEQCYWAALGGCPIRHLRYLSYLSGLDLAHESAANDDLVMTLDAVVDSYASVNSEAVMNSYDIDKEIQTDVTKLHELWHKGSRLATTKTTMTHAGQVPEELAPLIELFAEANSADRLQTLISDRITDVLMKVQEHSQFLAFEMLGRSADKTSRIDQSIVSDGKRLSPRHMHSMPYSLEFKSAGIRKLLAKIAKSGGANFLTIVTELRRHSSEIDNYEKLLFMSYIFALTGDWRLADEYTDLALSAHPKRNREIYEAFFFQAVCRAKNWQNVDGYRTALTYLEDAKSLRVGHEPPDARIGKERGVILFRWHAEDADSFKKAGYQYEDIEREFKQALTCTDEEEDLHLFLLNNLAYAAIEKDTVDASHCKQLLRALERTQKRQQPDRDGWSPFVLDTLAWGRWILRGSRLSFDERTSLLNDLDKALENGVFSQDQLSVIAGHREAIHASMS